MDPAIAKIITLLYGKLENHTPTSNYPPIKGLDENKKVIFLHTDGEESGRNTSFCNSLEAKWVVGLANYFSQQVKSSSINILTITRHKYIRSIHQVNKFFLVCIRIIFYLTTNCYFSLTQMERKIFVQYPYYWQFSRSRDIIMLSVWNCILFILSGKVLNGLFSFLKTIF